MLALTDGRKLGKANNAHGCHCRVLGKRRGFWLRRGSSFQGRVASGLLQAIGLSELITATREQFETLAIRLAKDPNELNALRTKLRANRLDAIISQSY
jgi:protein O-GlcNAc transferase